MRFYNTLSKKIEDFVSNEKKVVKLYTCGPTVYHYSHIGNLRTYIFEDVLEKSLNYLGYEVKRVMNITDVGHMVSDSDDGEDKMAIGAKREGKTVLEVADFYTKAFFSDIAKLNIKKPEIVKKATDHVSEYIEMIKKLEKDGYAYKSDGNVYFDITKIDNYYELSGKRESDLIIGARDDVDFDNSKKNPFDFGLWFTNSKFENHILEWDSPWGKGYPGWHIECSGIAIKYLGEKIDIHCGAVDNIFPHHSNEIAQSEAYLGHKWCNYWLHGEHLNDATGKMSKSNGEFLIMSLLESKGYKPLAYRFFCLQSHYRNQLVFTYEGLDSATSAYNKLLGRIASLNENIEDNNDDVSLYINKFKNAISDDLNIANVLTLLFELLKDEKLNDSSKLYLIKEFDKVLSLDLIKPKKEIDNKLEAEILEMIRLRDVAKQEKKYDVADEIRKNMKEKGIIIEDTKDGVIWKMEE
jgi:cysteinyl-tRNA synthetase